MLPLRVFAGGETRALSRKVSATFSGNAAVKHNEDWQEF